MKTLRKEVIALWGIANVGKSQTIKRVYQLLRLRHANAIADRDSEINEKDIKVILDINGIKIGIESQGDPNSRLISSLSWFVKSKCTVIICASRTDGKNAEAIDKLRLKGYDVVLWLKKERVRIGRTRINMVMAKRIVEEIDNILQSGNSVPKKFLGR